MNLEYCPTSCVYIKNTSFSFQHKIYNDKAELAAEAIDVIVMYDFNKNEKMAFPPHIKSQFEIIENKKL